MIIRSLLTFQYTLEFKTPVTIHGKELSEREGFILLLKSDKNTEGLGEIAPLTGVSKESLPAVLESLRKLKKVLPNISIPDTSGKLNGRLRKVLKDLKLLPSVHFGIEMAILNLFANTQNKPLYQFISEAEDHNHIRLSGLLQGTKKDVLVQAKTMIQDGFKSFKLKVGRNIEEEIDKIRAVSALASHHALLHIDANQTWDLKQAIHVGNEIGCAAVEYIEEPFPKIEDISEFYSETTIPVALDESILKHTIQDIKSIDGVSTIILKPTILGGIDKTWEWMTESQKWGIDPIISSSFESGLGVYTLAHISGFTSRDHYAGLDTLKYFKEDILKEHLEIQKGKIDITQRHITFKDLKSELLTEISL